MSRQQKRRTEIEQPSKVTALAELLRVTEKAGTMNVSRDYFRANLLRQRCRNESSSLSLRLGAREAGHSVGARSDGAVGTQELGIAPNRQSLRQRKYEKFLKWE